MSVFRNLLMQQLSSSIPTNVITITKGSLTYSWSSAKALASDLTLTAVFSDGSTSSCGTLSSGSNSGSFLLRGSLTATLTGFTVSPTSDSSYKYSVNYVSTEETIAVSPISLSFGSSAASDTITVTADCSWTAATSDSWLTVSQSVTSGDGTVTVTAAKNPNTSMRTGTVTITTAGGTQKTVSVSQKAATSGGLINTISVWTTATTGKYSWSSLYALASDITLYGINDSEEEIATATLSSGVSSGTFYMLDVDTEDEITGFTCTPTSDSSYMYSVIYTD